MEREIPPRPLWNLSILSDSAVCSSRPETRLFAKTIGLDPSAFDLYCVFDVTYGVYRIFMEAKPLPQGS